MTYPFGNRIIKMEKTMQVSPFCKKKKVGNRKEAPLMTSSTDITDKHVTRYKSKPSYP